MSSDGPGKAAFAAVSPQWPGAPGWREGAISGRIVGRATVHDPSMENPHANRRNRAGHRFVDGAAVVAGNGARKQAAWSRAEDRGAEEQGRREGLQVGA